MRSKRRLSAFIVVLAGVSGTSGQQHQQLGGKKMIPAMEAYQDVYSPYRSRNAEVWPVSRLYVPVALASDEGGDVATNNNKKQQLTTTSAVWDASPNTIVSIRDQPHRLVGVTSPNNNIGGGGLLRRPAVVPSPPMMVPSFSSPPPPPPRPLYGEGEGEYRLRGAVPALGNSLTSIASTSDESLIVDGGNLRPSHNPDNIAPPVDKSFLEFIADWEGKNDGDDKPPPSHPVVEVHPVGPRTNTDDDNDDREEDNTYRNKQEETPSIPLTALSAGGEAGEVFLSGEQDDEGEQLTSVGGSSDERDAHKKDEEKVSNLQSGEEVVKSNEEVEEHNIPSNGDNDDLLVYTPIEQPILTTRPQRMRYALPCCSHYT